MITLKLRADEDKRDPQMEKKCLKMMSEILESQHLQTTSVFMPKKIKKQSHRSLGKIFRFVCKIGFEIMM